MPDTPFNEHELQRVLARAAEIDAGGESQSRARLREIAAELDISPRAVEQALAEYERVKAAAVPTQQSVSGSTRRLARRWIATATAAVATAGTIAGAIAGVNHASRAITQPISVEFASVTLGALTLASLLIVLLYRERTHIGPMLRQLATFWLTWCLGFSFTTQSFHEDIAGFAAVGLTIAMATGVIARLPLREHSDASGNVSASGQSFATPVP